MMWGYLPPQKLIICISRSRIRRQYLVQIKSPCPWYILNPNSSKRTFWEPWPVKNGESEAGCWVLLGYVFAINNIIIYLYIYMYLLFIYVYIWIYLYIYRVNIVHYNTYLNTTLINTYMCIRMILKHVKRPIGWCLSLVIGRSKARQLSHAQWRGGRVSFTPDDLTKFCPSCLRSQKVPKSVWKTRFRDASNSTQPVSNWTIWTWLFYEKIVFSQFRSCVHDSPTPCQKNIVAPYGGKPPAIYLVPFKRPYEIPYPYDWMRSILWDSTRYISNTEPY